MTYSLISKMKNAKSAMSDDDFFNKEPEVKKEKAKDKPKDKEKEKAKK